MSTKVKQEKGTIGFTSQNTVNNTSGSEME